VIFLSSCSSSRDKNKNKRNVVRKPVTVTPDDDTNLDVTPRKKDKDNIKVNI
jgi:hypothetical protein